MQLPELLYMIYQKGASDLILKVGNNPMMRLQGSLVALELPPLNSEDTKRFAVEIMTKEQLERFRRDKELDISCSIANLCRFRASAFIQRGEFGLVFRLIPNKIPNMDELGLPIISKNLAMRPRGLVLVTGPAGCGKSTTIASMINTRNANQECHIITVEDPIEFVYQDLKAEINQREVGKDTLSFTNALKSVLRQDPDVIVVGEMRDLETISLAITAAETGHLVLSTLHTTDAMQTIDRIVDVFPPHQQTQVRMQLSGNLLGVISQVLLKRADGNGRVMAYEIMLVNSAIRNLIREAKTSQIPSAIQMGMKQGMTTLNYSLADLVRRKVVTPEEALGHTDNQEDLKALLARPVQPAPGPVK
ncbi:MAG: type IV pilus twitching motility protein PilT [Candidatus Edwardsbacteria bacterium]|nr:type IV pilus twitching motility protein PilT [Candidatus Edwardsbacteria bacterium]MBU1577409.1 type IV pilus twitching motility protein PilT [Candidatus Edwardsbacteria bacterium]MBU2462789.1 type IV pilus twitching motility protein PilT [Candidatus Edwardsbacteria bacterium]MBU2592976.1 type IV pilus twitching motility protein PilT [Candidatus Edwardsbacteria bacterium]